MRLVDFLDAQGIQLEITRYSNQDERWIARFAGCNVSDGVMLRGTYGTGKNPDEAIRAYLADVCGTKMKIETYESYRYFTVPKNLEWARV